MSYRCCICGCYLDPGEGLFCDDCREELKTPHKKHHLLTGQSIAGATRKQVHSSTFSGGKEDDYDKKLLR